MLIGPRVLREKMTGEKIAGAGDVEDVGVTELDVRTA
jgi:hypothetical protein